MSAAVVLRGPVGVGKSTTAAALHVGLAEREVPNACLDLDALSQSWPQYGAWNEEIRLRNVRAVSAVYREFGIDCFVLAGAVESTAAVDRLQEALAVDELLVCGLYAPIEVIEARLQSRIRTDVPLSWYRDRALTMLRQFAEDGLDDLTIDAAAKDPRTIGNEIADSLGWMR